MSRLCVHLYGKPVYDIFSTDSFHDLAREVSVLGTEKKKLCIVADSTVAALYLKEIEECLSPVCRQVDRFIFPAGEEQKNLDTVRDLYEVLIQKAYDRKDMLVALGGGVTGDLCGFAAATYLRGISFIQIPTTLLSQVDSSIGGKTGVDFDSYKNMVGAFHMPSLVYLNVSTLSTLPDEQFSSGMGEVIKHGLIQNEEYYRWLISKQEQIRKKDKASLLTMIEQSNKIKRDIVELDPKEKGVRAFLNLGHTFGHGIEKLKNFSMPHGHCVAVGCLAAVWMSIQRGNLPEDEAETLRQLLYAFSLPVQVENITEEEVLEAVKHDKKMDAGKIRFILLKKIGDAYIDTDVSQEEMRAGLACIIR